jgi:hypothetical protein
MANYMSESSFFRYTLHLKGEEVFGSTKQPADCLPSVNNDFHWLDRVNFFHPQVIIHVVQRNVVMNVGM